MSKGMKRLAGYVACRARDNWDFREILHRTASEVWCYTCSGRLVPGSRFISDCPAPLCSPPACWPASSLPIAILGLFFARPAATRYPARGRASEEAGPSLEQSGISFAFKQRDSVATSKGCALE